jgi:glycosyltransferase involved in cell wall biosynthesis
MIPGRVDIIIPLFNQEAYVRQCLESALAQTYKNITITVVNDGSTDYSRRVVQETIDVYMREDNVKREAFFQELKDKNLDHAARRQELWESYFGKKYKQSATYEDFASEDLQKRDEFYNRIKQLGIDSDEPRWALWRKYFPDGERVAPTILDQENRGLSESRNRAIRAGEGEFILPLDSDDYIDPTYLEKTVPLMADPQIGVVSTDMQYHGLLHNRIPPRGLTLEHEMRANELPVCSLIRRTAFEQTPRGYETLFIEVGGSSKVLGFEDWELFISLLKRGWKVAVVNEPLFWYRVRPNSMISQANTRQAGLIRLIHLLHPDIFPNG